MRRAAILMLAAMAACARTSGPVEIPAEDLPFPIAREADEISSTSSDVPVTVAFVRGDRLVEVTREGGEGVTVAERGLRVLLGGPDEGERARSITTELPRAVRLLEVLVVEHTAHVDLSGEFQQPAPPERIALRVAQVVWTLTGLPGVGAVAFAIDGEPAAVTTQSGAVVARPVARADYAAFAPRNDAES